MRAELIAFAALFAVVSGEAATAASVVTLSPSSGHPSQTIAGSGSGFGINEAVDLYLDTTDTQLLVTSSTGTLTFSLPIPASATPGAHSITAIGRKSGDAAQSTLTVGTAWGEFGFGAAHLGWNPYENVLSTSNVSSLGTLWSAAINSTGGTPAVVNGRVIIGTQSGVVALSTTTGATVWSKTFNELFYGSAAVFANVVYLGSSAGTVYALNANSGATIWTHLTGSEIFGSPLVFNGIVYVGTNSGVFYALKASTGTVLWSYATGNAIDGSAAFANGIVYFGSQDSSIYALNATTGALVWSFSTGGPVESSPAIANNVLYIGSGDGKVYAISTAAATAGTLVWSYATGGNVYGSPAVANGLVYIGSRDGNLYALNAHTGTVAWQQATAGIVRSAAVANGVVYATSDDNSAYVVAAYGIILATASTGPTLFGSPTIADGRLFVSSRLGTAYAFALGAGADARRAPAPSSLHPDFSLRSTY